MASRPAVSPEFFTKFLKHGAIQRNRETTE